MDGNHDGSQIAARGAHDEADQESTGGIFAGMLARLTGRGQSEPREATNDLKQGHGLTLMRMMRVGDVAIPRAEIVSAPVEAGLDALVQTFRESGLSRLPIYEDTLDTPVGMLHLKDLALRYGFNGKPKAFSVRGLLRKLLYVPPSMPVSVLLQRMQRDRIHMALVVDEYGGVDGLVTIEDLIETIIGEIEDEHDQEEDALWSKEAPGVYLCQARTPLEEFAREAGVDFGPEAEEDEVETLGGLVFVLSGRVPGRGEVISHPSGVEFEILDADPRRIKRMRVRLPGAGSATA